MKKLICGVFAVIALIVFVFFIKHGRNSYIEEPKNIEFQKHKLNIKEIKIPQCEEPILFVKTKNPTVAFLVIFKNEGARNFKNKPGTIPLLFSMIQDGAGKYSGSEQKQILDANSINFSIKVGVDSSSLSLYVVPEKFHLAMDMLQDILISAHLPEQKLEISKRNMKERLLQSNFDPRALTT